VHLSLCLTAPFHCYGSCQAGLPAARYLRRNARRRHSTPPSPYNTPPFLLANYTCLPAHCYACLRHVPSQVALFAGRCAPYRAHRMGRRLAYHYNYPHDSRRRNTAAGARRASRRTKPPAVDERRYRATYYGRMAGSLLLTPRTRAAVQARVPAQHKLPHSLRCYMSQDA